MTERCEWRAGARLLAPDALHDRVSRAYERATERGILALNDTDLGQRVGLRFGPAVDGPQLITRTAGSTGTPRRIIRSQASWTASFAVMASRFRITEADIYGVLGDLSHSLSFYALAEGLHLGVSVWMTGDQGPAAMARDLAESCVTVLYATPTQLRALALATDPDLRLSAVRVLVIGGGPFDGAAGRAALRLFPNARTDLFYGTSETSFLTLGAPCNDGFAPTFPGVELDLKDCQGRICAPGETGEVWVVGPYIAVGYAVDDDPPAVPPRTDDQGRMTLGERGVRNAAGHVRILGRGAPMVTVADCNVFPDAVEAWLLDREGVGHAAVLARPDALRGHRLEAAICWQGGDLSRLRADLRNALGPAATPARVIALQDWPLLPSGKTDLAQVRAALDLP